MVILVGVGGYSAATWYKVSRYAERIKAVAIGDSKDAVIRKMGAPDKVQSRPHWLWCNAATCESEFMYGTSIPPVWWVTGFDREGRVVWTAELNSP
jgi:hypothetical protein